MSDVLRGRIIREAYHMGKKFIMKLDDGSEVVVEELSGTSGYEYDYKWNTWTEITHLKDGRILSSWKLENTPSPDRSRLPSNLVLKEGVSHERLDSPSEF